jgi:hypothetical protein
MNRARHLPAIAAISTAALALGFTTPVSAQQGTAPAPVTADHNAGRDPAPQGFAAVFGAGSDAAVATYMQVEGGDTIRVFCIQHGVEFPTWDPASPPSPLPATGYTAQARSAARGTNAAGAAWLMENLSYGPSGSANQATVGTALTATGSLTEAMLVDAEASAVQLALWNLVNGTDISATVNSAIRTRALELVSLAQQNSSPEGVHAFAVTLTSSDAADGTRTLVASAKGVRGSSEVMLAGVPLTISAPAGSGLDLDPAPGVQENVTITTDSAGVATTAVFTAPATPVQVSASGQFTLPRGTVLTPQGADSTPGTADDTAVQQVITADPARVTRSASLSVSASSVDVSVPAAPEAEPLQDTAAPSLPRTGGWLSIGVILAGAAAGAAGVWLRRRRVTF